MTMADRPCLLPVVFAGRRGPKDGNFTHGAGYPRISNPSSMDMEGRSFPSIMGRISITSEVGTGRGFAPWISNGYPVDGWDPHVSETCTFA
jgi:hypothetical protein